MGKRFVDYAAEILQSDYNISEEEAFSMMISNREEILTTGFGVRITAKIMQGD